MRRFPSLLVLAFLALLPRTTEAQDGAGGAPVAPTPVEVAARAAREERVHEVARTRHVFRRAVGLGIATHLASAAALYAILELSYLPRRHWIVGTEDWDTNAWLASPAVAVPAATIETHLASLTTFGVARREAERRQLSRAKGVYLRAWAGHLVGRLAGMAFAIPLSFHSSQFFQDTSPNPPTERENRVAFAKMDASVYLIPAIVRAIVGSTVAARLVDRRVATGPGLAQRRLAIAPPSLAVSATSVVLGVDGRF